MLFFTVSCLVFMILLIAVYDRFSFCICDWSCRYCRLKLICVSCISFVAFISSVWLEPPAEPDHGSLHLLFNTLNKTVELHRLSRDGSKGQDCSSRFLWPALF